MKGVVALKYSAAWLHRLLASVMAGDVPVPRKKAENDLVRNKVGDQVIFTAPDD